MRHRIRAAGLIVDSEQRILLVREVDAKTGGEFWIPPGGGLELNDKSLIECLSREIEEETGLQAIHAGRLVYLREFIEGSKQTHHVEMFFEIDSFNGDIVTRLNSVADADLARPAQWFKQHELPLLCVYPNELKRQFWLDRAAGVQHCQYLGAQVEGLPPTPVVANHIK